LIFYSKEGELWYYALPAVLEANDIPDFPVDYTLIEYVRIRAGEWINRFVPGTARDFAEKEIGALRQSGLNNEPENDEIPFDGDIYRLGDTTFNHFSLLAGWPS